MASIQLLEALEAKLQQPTALFLVANRVNQLLLFQKLSIKILKWTF